MAVDLVIRDAARNAVVIVPSVTEEQAIRLALDWIGAGAIVGALSLELCRELNPAHSSPGAAVAS
jgi:hypothetical protein